MITTGERPHPRRGRLLVVSHACVLPVNQHVYAGLLALGWEVTVIAPTRWRHEYGAGAFASQALPELARSFLPIPVILAGRPQRHVYRRNTGRIIHRLAPDVILVEEETFALSAVQWGLAAHHAGIPFGVQADENLERPLPRVARLARRWTLRNASLVMARSPTAAELTARWGARGRIEVIPHAVPAWQELPKVLNRPFTVGYAGRLVPEKGIRDLVAAAMRVEGHLDVLLVGNGPLRGELESLRLPNGRLKILPSVSHAEMPSAYAEMDVLVLPSRTTKKWAEQFGRVLVEALSCGVPVIGSDSGEIPWVIKTTAGGRVFPEGDIESLAALLREFSSRPREVARLAEKGQRAARENFGAEAVARDLDAALLATAIDRVPWSR